MDYHASSADCHDWFGHHLQCDRRQLPAQFLHNCVPQEWHGRVPFSWSICLDYCLLSNSLGHHPGDCLPPHLFCAVFCVCSCLCPSMCLSVHVPMSFCLCMCLALAKKMHLRITMLKVLCIICRRPTSTPYQECPWLLPSCPFPTQPLPLLAPSTWASSQTLCTTLMATPKLTASLVYSMRLERWRLLMEATTSSWRFRWASVYASPQPIKTAASVLCTAGWTLCDLHPLHCTCVCA